MSTTSPLISVVMPVYNADVYLAEAIESILNQTYRHFECIIICDDPTDKTREIIGKYSESDSRITPFYRKKEGLVSALNKGCSLAKGKYIARMDADDISLPIRFQKQLDFLEAHPEIDVCGTGAEIYSDNNDSSLFSPPESQNEIKFFLLFDNCLAHPSVMMKTAWIQRNGYNENAVFFEDYELWLRTLDTSGISNIKDVLVKLRKHPDNISELHKTEGARNNNVVLTHFIESHYHLSIPPDILVNIRFPGDTTGPEKIPDMVYFLDRLFQEFIQRNTVSADERKNVKKFMARKYAFFGKYAVKQDRRTGCKMLFLAIKTDPVEITKMCFNAVLGKISSRLTKRSEIF